MRCYNDVRIPFSPGLPHLLSFVVSTLVLGPGVRGPGIGVSGLPVPLRLPPLCPSDRLVTFLGRTLLYSPSMGPIESVPTWYHVPPLGSCASRDWRKTKQFTLTCSLGFGLSFAHVPIAQSLGGDGVTIYETPSRSRKEEDN